MTLTIFGRKSSSNVQKVLWALDELGMAYERIDAGGPYGVVDRDDFAALNPVRRVPVLQEGAFTLWESHAILRFLARRSGRLMPHDDIAHALADQWMDFVATTLQPHCIGVFWQMVRLPEDRRDASALSAHRKGQDHGLAILETRLARSEWLTGDMFGLADIAAGSLMYRIQTLGMMPDGLPALHRWCAALSARPAYIHNVEVSYDELRA